MEALLSDLRYALRGFRSRPGYSIVALTTLALGIGMNAAIFVAADAALLRPLPFQEADRLVQVWQFRPQAPTGRSRTSWPTLRELQEDHTVFKGVAAYYQLSATWEQGGTSEPVEGIYVSANFLDVLGIRPFLGRGFLAGEDVAGAPPAVLVTHEFWRQRFNSDTGVLGRGLIVDGISMTVVGVLPEGFRWDPSGRIELVAVAQPHPEVAPLRNFFWYAPVARLQPGVSVSQASAHLQVVAAQLRERFPGPQANTTMLIVPLRDEFFGRLQPVLLVLLGGSGLVLLLVCANLANLQLAYGRTRAGELAIRGSLGATQSRLIRQLITESSVLALLGAGLGTLGASLLLPLVLRSIPAIQRSSVPSLEKLQVGSVGWLYSGVLVVLTVILFGLVPAIRNSASDLRALLNDVPTMRPGRRRVQEIAVGVQVAIAAAALSLAVLSGRSVFQLFSTDPGFRTRGLISIEARFPTQRFDTEADEVRAIESLLDAAKATPGIRSVATVDRLPGTGTGGFIRFHRTDVANPGPDLQAVYRRVNESYFSTMGIPLVTGRGFGSEDRWGSPPTAIVNRSFVRSFFPREDPLGKAVKFTYRADAPAPTIVGVVGDESVGTLDEPRTPVVYVPSPQSPFASRFVLVLRTDLSSADGSLVGALHRAVPGAALLPARRMFEVLEDAPPMFLRRYSMWLLAIFGAYALMLVTLGIFGLVSFLVSERTREFGIRMSVGATQGSILRLVGFDTLRPVVGGVVIGGAAAFGLARAFRVFLLEASPANPQVLVTVLLLLGGAAFLAALGPAVRAARISPALAMRGSRLE